MMSGESSKSTDLELPGMLISKGVQATFEAKCRRFTQLFEAAAIKELVSYFYHDDAVLEGDGLVGQTGRAAIQNIYMEARLSCHSIQIKLDPIEICDNVAYGFQTNINKRKDGGLEIHRGIMIWRLVDMDWFVTRDFFFTGTNPHQMSVDTDEDVVITVPQRG